MALVTRLEDDHVPENVVALLEALRALLYQSPVDQEEEEVASSQIVVLSNKIGEAVEGVIVVGIRVVVGSNVVVGAIVVVGIMVVGFKVVVGVMVVVGAIVVVGIMVVVGVMVVVGIIVVVNVGSKVVVGVKLVDPYTVFGDVIIFTIGITMSEKFPSMRLIVNSINPEGSLLRKRIVCCPSVSAILERMVCVCWVLGLFVK